MRLNKYISQCGISSRRGADSLIEEGRVLVNDKEVAKQGRIIDPETDTVKVDGLEIKPVRTLVYIAFNKPRKVMTTLDDPFKRRTIVYYLQDVKHRVYPVGRLDFDTEGLLLLTNDGELAYRLAHPKYQVKRIYETLVKGDFGLEQAKEIQAGIKLEDGKVGHAKEVLILGKRKNGTLIRLVLTEGRKREVRQLCEKVGTPVVRLIRVEFAGLTLRGLKSGQWRELHSSELSSLQSMVKIVSSPD